MEARALARDLIKKHPKRLKRCPNLRTYLELVSTTESVLPRIVPPELHAEAKQAAAAAQREHLNVLRFCQNLLNDHHRGIERALRAVDREFRAEVARLRMTHEPIRTQAA